MSARQPDKVVQSLRSLLGDENVVTDDGERRLYSQDVYDSGQTVAAIARPANTKELAQCIAAATSAGLAVVPRGGGMSYTSGYLATEKNSILVDMSRMNRILEINRDDMYVTVECGVTWKTLHEALKPLGLRTPYWGTLSGIKATVGGGLSQNSVFWGSGIHGSATDSVIALEVVLADGSILKTGAGARMNGSPFFRHFGPDLTGLFTGDTGALGFKATATFRLIQELPVKRFASFDFKNFDDQVKAMSEISRRGLAAECFGFDSFLQNQRLLRESFGKDVKALGNVMKAAGSVMGGIKEGIKVAVAGRRFIADVAHSVHVFIEERIDASADAVLAEVRDIAARHNGSEIENSIPKILRANPFGPVNTMVGPKGERWVPIHGLLPYSKTLGTLAAIDKLLEKRAGDMERFNIGIGYLLATLGTSTMIIEPVFFWPDALNDLHRHSVEPDVQAGFSKFPEDLDARAMVQTMRKEIAAIFKEMGAVHLQIGKSYDYIDTINPPAAKLVRALKDALDPKGRVNPGSLGLD